MRTFNNIPALVLRLGGGLCFIGHGVLALTAKAGFVALLHTFGLEEQTAIAVLKIVGFLDVIIGLFILFKPNKFVLLWAMAWAALTIVAWGIHGDSLMDLFRRATYIAAPMALMFLLYKYEQEVSETTKNNALQSIKDGAIPLPVMAREQEEAINNIDLSMICMKLMDENEGEGWSRRQCAEVAIEYRRYLSLKLLFPEEPIVPNLAIDTMWHYHILDTQAYYDDCMAVFGQILHHYPYFGMEGEEDERNFVNAFDRTKQLYGQTFDAPMEGPDYLASFRMSRSA